LDVRSQLAQHLVGFRRRAAKLFTLQRADLGNVPFNDEFTQRHRFLLANVTRMRGITWSFCNRTSRMSSFTIVKAAG
jgi:hypothetical protein